MLPRPLRQRITNHFQTEITTVTLVSGGDINQAARVTLNSNSTIFVKWHYQPPAGMFPAEAFGLTLLAQANALRVPQVYFAAETYLAMEWLGNGGQRSTQVAAQLGEKLAQQHQFTVDQFGLEQDNYCGLTPQQNTPSDNWVDFFATRRLGAQMELAAQQNRLPRQRARQLEALITKLGDLLPVRPPASLLHGDLWGGNWLVTATGEPALIDPAVYFGHREADLAFTELFGGFPAAFYNAYQATWPLETGYRERKDIYNLYHLLNHLNLFGEGYGSSVDAVLRRYA